MADPTETFNTLFCDIVSDIKGDDYAAESTAAKINNLATLLKVRPLPTDEPVVVPDPVPETRWGRFKLAAAKVLDNETTRTVIKAAGSVAGVGIVAYATINKDHVLERQALDQAHQQQIR